MKKSLVRDSFFRKAVIHAYDYRCSLCNLKVIKSLSQSIVDGAHIKPFAQFYDNNINNGISLCKNHHWAFDRGIFSIDDNYQVLISDNFSEESPNSKPIREFQGETILLPNSPTYFPSIEAIQWHRQNIFRQ
ncbi:D-3-phosphoglycerate dehydrogenase [Crocosphaera watsonii WH 0402]|nr:HNH endonuclease [Crocosphaera watsonii]CCQ65194.1 D-3-phosphoglycerate dehydrogenase [Crocosphaera watsonii WH 0402]